MEKKYEIKLNQFSGPLEKLLELIEEKQMKITLVNLAEITNDFLKYLQTLTEQTTHPNIIADFVVIASRLLLIKSKALLPSFELTTEEEKDIKDLELHLKIYKEFKDASLNFKKLWDKKDYGLSRELLSGLPIIFYPPPHLSIKNLKNIVINIIAKLQIIIPEKKTIKKLVFSLKEKTEELLSRFQKHKENNFNNIVQSDSKSKLELIVFFLAILHLIKDKFIVSAQQNQFSDIIIKQNKSTNNE
ncbi:segregation/condensation protein A [Patescibacteria group bacterium]|nr:segregation/condensation protein A [Patescibacteria group bacterium]